MIGFVSFSIISLALVMPFVDTIFKPAATSTSSSMTNAAPTSLTGISNIKQYLNSAVDGLIHQYDRLTLLQYLCVLIVVMFLLKNVFSFLQSYYMASIEQGLMRDLRMQLYGHLHTLSLSYFSDEKKGNLISRITNDVRVVNDSIMAVINSIFRDPPQIVAYVVVLFIFNWQLTLLVFILVPLTGYTVGRIGDSLKRESMRSQEKMADLTSILDETLSGIRIVKAFGMERFEINKFRLESQKYYKIFLRIVRKRNLAAPISEFLSIIVVTIILWFMGSAILRGTSVMSVGGFLFYLGMILQMMQPLKLFAQMFNSYKEGVAAGDRLFAILDIQPRIIDKPHALKIESFASKIEFENVHFRYDTGDEVLKGISCTINKGEVVAIVGPSGSGKSTLVDLIPRFFDVTDGQILVDGKDLRDVTVESLRALMGIVTQETILFNDTVASNIAYGLSDIPKERITAAAKVANAHMFISELAEGYNTNIGDRGVKLSGGERQRISLARAILKNPPILILDEATSALDTGSEILVQQAIEHLMIGRTSIVIAHRLSTIQHATKILVIEDGVLKEIGKHTELVAKPGSLYKKLYDMQFRV
jgi:subfamily B ATP-binding cassette protein MsbA